MYGSLGEVGQKRPNRTIPVSGQAAKSYSGGPKFF